MTRFARPTPLTGMIMIVLGAVTFQTADAARPLQQHQYLNTRLPLFLNKSYIQDVEIIISEHDSSVSISLTDLKTSLGQHLLTSVIEELEKNSIQHAGVAWVGFRTIQDSGLVAVYDAARLEIHISIPAILHRSIGIPITRFTPQTDLPDLLQPSPLSSYLNMNFSQDFASGRLPLKMLLDGAINTKGWVLEGAGTYTELQQVTATNTSAGWQRGDVRLVRDDPDRMVRFSAGDLYYPVEGFLRFRPAGGIAAVREFSLQPYRNIRPGSSHEFILSRPSKVKVLLNGRTVATRDLVPGKYDLQNFPFITGINDATVEITDDFGRTETINLMLYGADKALAKDIHQFSYAIGAPSSIPSSTNDKNRSYDTGNINATIHHKAGITNHLTMSGYLQTDKHQSVLGAGSIKATSIGNFSLEPALSRYPDLGLGYGFRFGYLYTDFNGPARTSQNLSTSFEARSTTFAAFGEQPLSTTPTYNITVSGGRQMLHRTALGLSVSYEIRPSADAPYDSVTSNLSMSKSWLNNIDTTFLITSVRNHDSTRRFGALFLLHWQLPSRNQSLSTSFNTENTEATTRWAYSPPSNTVGAYQLSTEASTSTIGSAVEANASYTGNRFKGGINHNVDFGASDKSNFKQTTSVHAGTALAFAGGRFSLSRPIIDSFALVAPEKDLSSSTIHINPHDDGSYDSSSDWIGVASTPDLVSYRHNQINLDVPSLPLAVKPPTPVLTIHPTYKSGTLIKIGEDPTLLVTGVLANEAGDPLKLWSGELRSIDPPSSQPILLSTNRNGRFSMEQVKPGGYQLFSLEDEKALVKLEIKESSTNHVDIGKIQIK
ncbi:MAG: fimbria/pilus outer membrane usher protein [Bdellovibrionota bacterium]